MISPVGDNPEHAALPATAARSSMFSLAARSRSARFVFFRIDAFSIAVIAADTGWPACISVY